MKLTTRLLGKNISPSRIIAFILSNFMGLAIVGTAFQLWQDAGNLLSDDKGFLKNDWLVVNKRVTSANAWEGAGVFSEGEIADICRQPWVREAGRFSSSRYNVAASVEGEGRGLSTMMFFEAVPDEFVDNKPPDWTFREGDSTVPIIISKDYLALYNFGFAGSAGLPQISENLLGGIPLTLHLSSSDGMRSTRMQGRVVGFSNRLNTILVPEGFMEWSNSRFGDGGSGVAPSRLIIDVSSPGDTAIGEYLAEHDLEVAGDKTASQASFLLKGIIGVVFTIGIVISLLSLFVLLLSLSLLMERNRRKLHGLLMLGYPVAEVARPYALTAAGASAVAALGAAAAVWGLDAAFGTPIRELGGTSDGIPLTGPLACLCFGLLVAVINVVSVYRKVRKSW